MMVRGCIFATKRTPLKARTEPIVLQQLPQHMLDRAPKRKNISKVVPAGGRLVKLHFSNVRCAPVTHTAAPLLTVRGSSDLPAQLRFNVRCERSRAQGWINSEDTLVLKPDVPEWLAGLPQGWTDGSRPLAPQGSEMEAFIWDGNWQRPTCFSVFSGCGGLDLGLHQFLRTVAYCENEPACAQVLQARMMDGVLDTAPVLPDIQRVTAAHFEACPDVVAGGFPCQDVSVAGKRAGLEGTRTVLFAEIARILRELRVRFGCLPHTVFLENVGNITSPGNRDVWRAVLGPLGSLNYDARWATVSCEEVGLPMVRSRWLVLATLPDAPMPEARPVPAASPPAYQPMPEASRWFAEKGRHGEFEARLRMVGNILVPQQARFGWQLLQGMRREPSPT